MSRPAFSSRPPLQRILILIPPAYLFYLNQGLALREAFVQSGIDCLLLVDGMGDDSLRATLASFAPQAVLSINHARPAVLDRFPDICHLRWIQDNQFDQEDYRRQSAHAASDICYFATSRLPNVIPLQGHHHTGTPCFAANSAAKPATDAPSAAFSLVAYIPTVPLQDACVNTAPQRRLKNPARRRAISDAARELISQRHTWRHRVQQIVTDLQR